MKQYEQIENKNISEFIIITCQRQIVKNSDHK